MVVNDLNTRFKPLILGISHLNSGELWQHTFHTPRTLFLNDIQRKNHSKITILDATYIHIGTSANIRAQQKTYSFHEKTNLFKPMICGLPDGYIYDIFPLNPATENDVTILNILKFEPEVRFWWMIKCQLHIVFIFHSPKSIVTLKPSTLKVMG